MNLDLEQLENLTKIRIPEGEREEFAQSMTAILDYVSQLQKVETDAADMLEHITPNVNVWRADEVMTDAREHQRVIDAFPKKLAGLLEVPAVFE